VTHDIENHKFCSQQLRLCSNQLGFPTDKDVVGLLVNTLIKHAKTQDHAARMITRWIEVGSIVDMNGSQRSAAPTVADIIRMAHVVDAEPVPVEGCERCNPAIRMDNGAIVHDGPHSHVIGRKGGYERCGCVRGAFLASKDQERALSAKAGL